MKFVYKNTCIGFPQWAHVNVCQEDSITYADTPVTSMENSFTHISGATFSFLICKLAVDFSFSFSSHDPLPRQRIYQLTTIPCTLMTINRSQVKGPTIHPPRPQ